MADPRWWSSFEKMDAIFRNSASGAIAAATLATVCWIVTFRLAAVVCAVVATFASLIALFTWLRRDDLGRGGRLRR
jgi:hypothetical protein